MIKKIDEILTQDNIDFIPERLYYFFCPIPKTTKSLTIDVFKRKELITPFINFTYPDRIGLCGEINITLISLDLIGKRQNDTDYSIIWRISNMSVGGKYLNVYQIKSISNKMTENFTPKTSNKSLTLPSLYFPVDSSINISITVTNFLKKKYTFNCSIETTKLPLPDLVFSAPDVLTTYVT